MARFVSVDLETTGNSVKNGDEIIEIGIVVIEDGKIIDEYESNIKPNGSIPPFVSQLTGISESDLVDAPTFKEVIPKILPFFDDCFFIAHPVHFDYEFLNQSLVKAGHSPIACAVIDTVELSRVFFPSAPGYRLQDLTNYLNIKHFKPHRALSDAYVTALIFLEIIQKMNGLPLETLLQLKPLISNFQTDTEFFFDDLIAEKRQRSDSNYALDYQYGLAIKQIREIDVSNNANFDDFNDYLNETLSEPLLENREGQQEIAKEIYSAFQDKQHRVIEAPSGLGKTLAYLLAAYAYSRKYDVRTLISTYTLQLQKQIFRYSERYPNLFPAGSLALLKSPSNYLHVRRFKAFYDRSIKDSSNFDITLSLAIILVWLTETETGDVEELQLPSRGQDIWKLISCDHDDEPTDRSSYFFFAKERAKKAAIVIVNHAFLTADFKKGRKAIPPSRQIIVDEAHHFENVTRNQLSNQIDYISTLQLFQSLARIGMSEVIETARINADSFFRLIYQAVDFLHSPKDPVSDTGKIQLSVDEEALEMIFSGEIREQLNQFLLSCDQLRNSILKKYLKTDLERSIQTKANRQLEEIIEFLTTFFQQEKKMVRWIEIDQQGAKNAASLNIEQIDLSEQLSSWYGQYTNSIVFMSSTLQLKNSFQHFLAQIGLSEETPTSIYALPSAYVNRTEVLIPADFPNITDVSAKTYAQHVASFVDRFHAQTNKKMLVLFTSYQLLKDTYERLQPTSRTVSILAQGIQSSSRDKLKKLFEETDDGILLGTNSFWEGVDLLNDTEKIICIARLPFESPNHPVYQAKWNLMKQQKENPFEQLALPLAITRFRQAFGRLIRHSGDRGLMIILDKRVMSKRYGKQFIQSLGETSVFYEDTQQIIDHAKKWLSYDKDNNK
ncbi:helicase C-terminal domain-containing protein [Allobacillus sp. GCM10007491]|uniref:3'-5' exonuclease DinG n=1 Tax=Allobacillus saliphilus TaxID=2912308 RepID=A0A941CU33_9BACI|nr:helicase C-terminal domain-containing protein [Allobacillus saliphilus]MBR7553229.1 DEAD/DEAH box helicase family protein [Allobacillus saliphilus]